MDRTIPGIPDTLRRANFADIQFKGVPITKVNDGTHLIEMILSTHRALLGSLERFFGILIEHYAGAFPAWLAPIQAEIIPIADRHIEAGNKIAAELRDAGPH